ncbi:MAG: hypothetical protein IJS90_00230 [Clostridia bacterium]|nr:hypothetical protein [Clostridia bacterium]
MKNRIFVSVFSLLLAALSVFTLAMPKKDFSDNENRTLAKFPELTFENVKDGGFTLGFSEWLSDHFIWRDAWVSVKAAVSVAAGRRENGGVYLTKDGSFVDGFSDEDAEFFETNVNALKSFCETVKSGYNIDVISIIAPTATVVYEEKLPQFAVTADSDALFEKLGEIPGFVDLRSAMEQNSGEYIYYRTDHHWTYKGAYFAYEQYEKAIGRTPLNENVFAIETVSDEFFGTLYSRFGLFMNKNADTLCAPAKTALGEMKVTNSKGETCDSIYSEDALGKKDKYLYFLGGNDSLIKIETGSATGKKLLLIKDSYANSFLPYLIPDSSEIYVVDMRYYTGAVTELIEEAGITDVLVLYNLKSFASDRYFRFINE